ncbi:hypothetical protein JB92DRAFT_186481 [Gautieria morchelliformis]|nr:hypothetical protein JB92DRAFT_186481 [Gautieria morchelliformis]
MKTMMQRITPAKHPIHCSTCSLLTIALPIRKRRAGQRGVASKKHSRSSQKQRRSSTVNSAKRTSHARYAHQTLTSHYIGVLFFLAIGCGTGGRRAEGSVPGRAVQADAERRDRCWGARCRWRAGNRFWGTRCRWTQSMDGSVVYMYQRWYTYGNTEKIGFILLSTGENIATHLTATLRISQPNKISIFTATRSPNSSRFPLGMRHG